MHVCCFFPFSKYLTDSKGLLWFLHRDYYTGRSEKIFELRKDSFKMIKVKKKKIERVLCRASDKLLPTHVNFYL